jgi:hypothetical protein
VLANAQNSFSNQFIKYKPESSRDPRAHANTILAIIPMPSFNSQVNVAANTVAFSLPTPTPFNTAKVANAPFWALANA